VSAGSILIHKAGEVLNLVWASSIGVITNVELQTSISTIALVILKVEVIIVIANIYINEGDLPWVSLKSLQIENVSFHFNTAA
jgi:hypothetical protein